MWSRSPLASLVALAIVLAAAVLWPRSESPRRSPAAPEALSSSVPGAPAPATAGAQPARARSIVSLPRGGTATRAPAGRSEPLERGPTRSSFEGLPIVAQEDGVPDREGRFSRLKVFRTQMKYPLVRVEERWRKNPATGEDALVSRSEAIADHVLVRLAEGATREDLERMTARLGMRIRQAPRFSKVYLVSFDIGTSSGSMIHSLERSLDTLRREKIIRASEADFVLHVL